MAAPQHARWLDRIVGAAIGASSTAWWLWPRTTAHDVAIAQGDVALVAQGAPAPEVIVEPTPVSPPTVVATAPPLADAIDEPQAHRAADEPLGDAAVAAAAAPELPLPRMPGDTRLSSSSRFDEPSKSWIVKAAYRVVAREHHVVAFYRKALADQGLTVTHSQAQPGADGSVKTYLHGKSGRVHAQVGIAPRSDILETRVWILWRTRA